MADAIDELHPVQNKGDRYKQARLTSKATARAYEVYCHLHGAQPAMMDLEGRGCRGGFSVGELLAFLYARSFPKDEWRARAEEVFRGKENLN